MIRYCEIEDIKEVASIITEDWKIAYKGIIDDDFLANINASDREKRMKEQFKVRSAFVFEDEEGVKGYCRFGDNDEERETGEIYALYIKWNERNKGIGSKLVEIVKEMFKEEGYQKMVIWCLEQNTKGRSFYEKMGGKLERKEYKMIGEKKYLEVCYQYELNGGK